MHRVITLLRVDRGARKLHAISGERMSNERGHRYWLHRFKQVPGGSNLPPLHAPGLDPAQPLWAGQHKTRRTRSKSLFAAVTQEYEVVYTGWVFLVPATGHYLWLVLAPASVYVQAIVSIVSILEKYDEDKNFEAYGFGGMLPNGQVWRTYAVVSQLCY